MQEPLTINEVEIFKETQKQQRIWLWVICLDVIVCFGILMFIFSKASHEAIDILPPILIALFAFGFVIWILLASKIEVTIDHEGVNYRYPVFKSKWSRISKEEINTFSV